MKRMQVVRPIPIVIDDNCGVMSKTVNSDISQRVCVSIELAVNMCQAEGMVGTVFTQPPDQGETLFIKSCQILGSAPPLAVQVTHDKFAVAVYKYSRILHRHSML